MQPVWVIQRHISGAYHLMEEGKFRDKTALRGFLIAPVTKNPGIYCYEESACFILEAEKNLAIFNLNA